MREEETAEQLINIVQVMPQELRESLAKYVYE
jgi:hypothetical protein